jgi:2,4-dienoyl-CoA reductase-like NADH-dependent reductase (Old Yellow Enzyme family)
VSPFQSLLLPNGSVILNRIAKVAMEETMADAGCGPSTTLLQLYRRWAAGGAGLLLTGNVMIDRRAVAGPGGLALEDASQLGLFREWARIGQSGGARFWMRLNHPGRHVHGTMDEVSAPKAMAGADIAETIARFANAARLAAEAGFSGVQIHAADGYLLSQFLSPLTNRRTDRWGGSLANRARFLIDTIWAVRLNVPADFGVSVKLDKGDVVGCGFDAEEGLHLVKMLNDLPVDLVELSGGGDEAAAILPGARDIAGVARMPIMVTGGIHCLAMIEQVLANGAAMAGIGTAPAIWSAMTEGGGTVGLSHAPATMRDRRCSI